MEGSTDWDWKCFFHYNFWSYSKHKYARTRKTSIFGHIVVKHYLGLFVHLIRRKSDYINWFISYVIIYLSAKWSRLA